MSGMPMLFYRYLLKDLLRTMGILTVVLVIVAAFGLTIKPLAAGLLLDLGQTLTYTLLATVPMLEFAIPMAAGFAVTICYYRLMRDREIMAACAGGVSYLLLLVPVAALGVVLVVLMMSLSYFVIPQFWGLMERVITQDVARQIQASIGQGETYVQGDLQIWASDMILVENPEDTDADIRLVLLKVTTVSLDEDNRIKADISAEQMVMDVFRDRGTTRIEIEMSDAMMWRQEDGMLGALDRPDTSIMVLDHHLADHPKRMTLGELRATRRDPEGYSRIQARKKTLVNVLRERVAWSEIQRQIASAGLVRLVATGRRDRVYEVRASSFSAGEFLGEAGTIQITQMQEGRPVRTFASRKAVLRRTGPVSDDMIMVGMQVGSAPPEDTLGFDLVLTDTAWSSVDQVGEGSHRDTIRLENLHCEGVAIDTMLDIPSHELLARAGELARPTPAITAAVEALRREGEKLQREIPAWIQRRAATSLSLLLIMMLGACLSILLSHAAPLLIYSLAYLPAMLNFILISSGGHLMQSGEMIPGQVVLWLGSGLMLCGAGVLFMRISRN